MTFGQFSLISIAICESYENYTDDVNFKKTYAMRKVDLRFDMRNAIFLARMQYFLPPENTNQKWVKQ